MGSGGKPLEASEVLMFPPSSGMHGVELDDQVRVGPLDAPDPVVTVTEAEPLPAGAVAIR